MKSFVGYLRSQTGSVATTFAVSALGLILAVGCAIDYQRWSRAQTELQSVVDAAALAAAASPKSDAADLKAIALDYIGSNGQLAEIRDMQEPEFSYDSDQGRLTVAMNGKVDMAFMSLAGIFDMDVYARSQVQQPTIPPVEAVLVLDTTYSMVGSKIDTLKTAAGNLVTSILANDEARVGIVPFASYVNVGVSRRNEPWANVPADSTTQTESCSTSYPNAKNCTTTKTTTTCTSTKDGVTITSSCTKSSTTCESWGDPVKTCKPAWSSTKDGVTITSSCTKSSTTCESWGDPVKTCKPATSTTKFYGCFGSRAEAYRPVISSIDQQYPGMMNTTCAAEILELTDNESTVGKMIKNLSVNGETYLPGGITWGWNMLTPEAPLTSALSVVDLQKKGGKKVMVLMTDGANTLAPTNANAGSHSAIASSKYKNTTYTNDLTAKLCENVKADGIEVYTVLFDVKDATIETLLRNCASEPAKSYVASDSAELIAAFDDIAKQLAQLRIVQ
jgi:Flp pilus assembly protein TadG